MKILNVYSMKKGDIVIADIEFQHGLFCTSEYKNKRVYGIKAGKPYIKANGERIEIPTKWFPDRLR